MNCVEYSPRFLSDLIGIINTQLINIPPGWTLTEAQVAQTINTAPELWTFHYPEQSSVFETETLCIYDHGCLVAAAQWGYPSLPAPGLVESSSILFWVVAEPNDVDGIRVLLKTIAHHSRASGRCRITTTRFSFGVGWLGIPVMWSTIVNALQEIGFIPGTRWVVHSSSVKVRKVSEPQTLSFMQIDWQVSEHAREWLLRLHADGSLVGECCAWGIPPRFSGTSGYSDWVTLEWLGVEPAYRRKGIGKWLVVDQLRRQEELGISFIILWTDIDNQPILGLCKSLGFTRGPECWEYIKTID